MQDQGGFQSYTDPVRPFEKNRSNSLTSQSVDGMPIEKPPLNHYNSPNPMSGVRYR